jgi:hypothetical protein
VSVVRPQRDVVADERQARPRLPRVPDTAPSRGSRAGRRPPLVHPAPRRHLGQGAGHVLLAGLPLDNRVDAEGHHARVSGHPVRGQHQRADPRHRTRRQQDVAVPALGGTDLRGALQQSGLADGDSGELPVPLPQPEVPAVPAAHRGQPSCSNPPARLRAEHGGDAPAVARRSPATVVLLRGEHLAEGGGVLLGAESLDGGVEGAARRRSQVPGQAGGESLRDVLLRHLDSVRPGAAPVGVRAQGEGLQ